MIYGGLPTSPLIVARTSQVGGSGTSQSPTLPTGVVAGNLIIQTMTCPAATTISAFSSGWTKLQDTTGGGTRLAVFAKIATGTDSLTITLSPASFATFGGLRLSGTISSLSNVVSSIVAGLDPPSVTPSHGADAYTAITVLGWVDVNSITTYPTNYLYQTSPGAPAAAGRPGIGFGDRYLPAGTTTEDPSAFTGGMTVGIAATILVYSG